MNKERDIFKKLSSLEKKVVALGSKRKLSVKSNLFVELREVGGGKRRTMSRLLSDERAFKIAVALLLKGHFYKTVVEELDKSMGFKISDSSLSRFWIFFRQAVLDRSLRK